MKSFLKPALILATAANAFAQQEPGSHRFQTLPELTRWAETGSFGGGKLDLVSHGSSQIAIVSHEYTSGVKSSGIFVFVKRDKGWDEALRLGPYWMDGVGYKQKGDTVILKMEQSRQEILRFSIAALHRQFDDPRNNQ